MSMREIRIEENGIFIQWLIDGEGCLKLLHFSPRPLCREDIVWEAVPQGFPFIGLNVSGLDRPFERHGNKYIVTAPGYRMRYAGHEDTRNHLGRLLKFYTADEETGIQVESFWQFYDGLSLVRIWHQVENRGKDIQTLEYISNFHYEGIEKEGSLPRDEKIRLWIPHNSWQRELNWKCFSLPELGMEQAQPDSQQRSSAAIRISNTGNWSTKEYLPMGILENTQANTELFWQIEHNGSWHWEIGDQNGHLYLALGGPNELYSHWFKTLKPGERFVTVKAAVGVTDKGLSGAMGTLTQYRRIIRRPNRDNEALPVIFNDYMNCLWGKPQAEKEFPLIRAAAEIGCEYFCIDAGWYADGDWWDQVGEWEESRVRFPNGLKEVTDNIRSLGMVPGVWLEPEVMGIHCRKASQVPDSWFFLRHGRRVYDRSRFQLDYRNPQVREYMTQVIDRLVKEYGIGYIKMDYNIEPGIGTEWMADSCGDGMLEHERCYLEWLDQLWETYPDLVIENCGSGGLRMDYAMLSRCSIQSTSDQDDYLRYSVIAANAPTGVAPEQAAVWTYPMNHPGEESPEALREETIFNMVNAMLLRIHQSGQLAQLDPERKDLVAEGIQVYKQIRKDIPQMEPIWPLGLASYHSPWACLGLIKRSQGVLYLAVWKRKEGEGDIEIPIPFQESGDVTAQCIYPKRNCKNLEYSIDPQKNVLQIKMGRQQMGRLFLLNSADSAADRKEERPRNGTN